MIVTAIVIILGGVIGWVWYAEHQEREEKRERLAELRRQREQGKRRYMGKLTPLGKSTIIVDRRK